ncbi:MAG TPA: hypothetical protein VF550_00085 [Polyangia bacterium]
MRLASTVRPGTSAPAARRGAEAAAGRTTPRVAEPGLSAEISAELASVAAALAQDDEDAFSEIPTVANRANSTVSQSEIDREAGQGFAGAGAYCLVRPAISDRIEVPVPAAPKRPIANRVIIGVTRKS